MTKEHVKEVSWGEAAAAINAGKPIPNGVLRSPYGRSSVDVGKQQEATGEEEDRPTPAQRRKFDRMQDR